MKEDAAGSGLEPAGVLFIYLQMLRKQINAQLSRKVLLRKRRAAYT